jgi:hypothetical protein
MIDNSSFEFYTERRLIVLTGMVARNLDELLGGLESVGGSSIFYHTHQQYLAHHFEKPLFYNDFALWIAEALQFDLLAEQLAAIDLLSFTSVRALREEIIARIRKYLAENPNGERTCPPGDEFYFSRSKSFVLPTGIAARDPADFFGKLPRVSNESLFYHFFEARLRLERATNDFSRWLADRSETDLAREIDSLDPYIRSLDELKADIIGLGAKRGWQ